MFAGEAAHELRLPEGLQVYTGIQAEQGRWQINNTEFVLRLLLGYFRLNGHSLTVGIPREM